MEITNHRTMCRESQISLIITVSVIIDLKNYRARLFFFRCAHNDDRLVIFSFSITATLFLTLVGYVKHNSRFTQSSGCCFTRDSFRFNRVPFAISFFVDRTHRVAISNDTPRHRVLVLASLQNFSSLRLAFAFPYLYNFLRNLLALFLYFHLFFYSIR